MAKKLDPDAFNGPALARLRGQAGLSVRQLAEKAGAQFSKISALENGRQQPSWALAVKLARALGCPLDAFRA